jgi:CRP/FNR family transcriptional regulator, polysaccharide utilization system transcription regulator
MKHVGLKKNILKASEELQTTLDAVGSSQHYSTAQVLFCEDGNSVGVYLVCKGKVRMSVRGLPSLDRDFAAGSLLGLPATFTGHAYSLTAVTLAESEVVFVPREKFLELMHERPDLCREATDMLGREVTFIQSALAERRRQLADMAAAV